MSKTITETTHCDQCGVVIPNNWAPITIYSPYKNGQFIIRRDTASLPIDGGKEFCSRQCAACWWLKLLGYPEEDFNIPE